MKDYRLTIKVRNNRILKAIEEAGGTPGKKWCDSVGLTYGCVNDLINMTSGPLGPNGEIRDVALKLCDVLGKLPQDLWSNEQLYPLEKNFSEMNMDHEQVMAMLPQEDRSYVLDSSGLEQRQTRKLLDQALETLTAKQRAVLRMKYEDDRSLDEIGEVLSVSRERVRQIEASAIRKLKSPERVGLLVDVIDVDAETRAQYKKMMEPGFRNPKLKRPKTQQEVYSWNTVVDVLDDIGLKPANMKRLYFRSGVMTSLDSLTDQAFDWSSDTDSHAGTQ